MACAQCVGIAQEFDDGMARRELRSYRRRGPSKTTRMMLGAIRRFGVERATFLDVGGGVGVIQHELIEAGAAAGTSVDASPAYLETARAEAERRGYAARMRYVLGDFVETSSALDPADVVTLDRVICCYHDMPALVDSAASRSRRLVGLVFPRSEKWLVRFGVRLINLVQTLRRRPFRVFAHRAEDVRTRLEHRGFARTFLGTSFFWQVHVYALGAEGQSPG